MSIPRCPHGVYSPDGDGKPTVYCSGCATPQDSGFKYSGYDHDRYHRFAYGEDGCPCCHTKKNFKYVNEWEWHCGKCGADALDDGECVQE